MIPSSSSSVKLVTKKVKEAEARTPRLGPSSVALVALLDLAAEYSGQIPYRGIQA